MKAFVGVAILLLLAAPIHSEQLLEAKGPAPALPSSGKWIGVDKPPHMADLKGKVVIVHFWFEGSDACKCNAKVFEEWVARHGASGLRILGVHGPDYENNPDRSEIEKRAKDLAKIFPTVIDETDLSMREWKVERVPTLFIIDKKGQLRYTWEGQLSYRRLRGDLLLEGKIVDLLNEK